MYKIIAWESSVAPSGGIVANTIRCAYLIKCCVNLTISLVRRKATIH